MNCSQCHQVCRAGNEERYHVTASPLQHVADDVSWESEGPAEMVFTGIRHGKQEALGFFMGIGQVFQNAFGS